MTQGLAEDFCLDFPYSELAEYNKPLAVFAGSIYFGVNIPDNVNWKKVNGSRLKLTSKFEEEKVETKKPPEKKDLLDSTFSDGLKTLRYNDYEYWICINDYEMESDE